MLWARWRFAAVWLCWLAACGLARAAKLSDPQVDAYNLRVGTETFAGMYQFTSNTLLVETAQAITNLGSDTIKLYMGPNTSGQSGVTLTANLTNLLTLARDEPSYRQVFDMPFRHFVVWTYPLSNPEPPFTDGNYSSTEQARDYREIYDLTRYFLTNYNNSGKTFYLGHWEGDGYLKVNNWTTNPSPAVVTAMIAWLNNRQQAVDDAKRHTAFTNVNVFNYAECNRVRDAMLNGSNNNARVINSVVPYVTNLDYLSYSSYDAENLGTADLYATLNYMQSMLPTNKDAVVPGERIWIGEYGWGRNTVESQEPLNRAYIQRLLNWNYHGHCLPFILFWEIYSNYNPNGGTNFCLIDYQDHKVPSWYLQHYFFNDARLLVARFQETNGRLPDDAEFSALVSPLLDQPLSAPVNLAISNLNATVLTNTGATVAGRLTQGVYGDEEAGVWVFWGRRDGGTVPGNWESSRFLGVNTNFNPATFQATLGNLAPQTNYYFRFYAANSSGAVWAPASAQFSTALLNPYAYGWRMRIRIAGYDRGETLTDFPVLVRLEANVPGFSYGQFASPTGGDLRFTDGSGTREIPYEMDEWNPGGISTVWVQVPALSGTNDAIWAYWGNSADVTPPDYSTNGAVWVPPAFESVPPYEVVYHLEQTGFPYLDSTLDYPALAGLAPGSAGGLAGLCGSFTRGPYLDAGPINLGSAFTVSAWVNVSAGASSIQAVWANGPGGYSSAGFRFYVNSWNTQDGALWLEAANGSAGSQLGTAAGAVPVGQWHLVTAAINHDAGTAQLYVDGTLAASGSIRNDFPTTNDVELGRFADNSFPFQGLMDETRIRAGVSSSNWIWASWMTLASNAVFQSYSAVSSLIVTLRIQRSGNDVVLTWPAGTLQTASQAAGPYNDVVGAASPFTNAIAGAQEFYRVQVE